MYDIELREVLRRATTLSDTEINDAIKHVNANPRFTKRLGENKKGKLTEDELEELLLIACKQKSTP